MPFESMIDGFKSMIYGFNGSRFSSVLHAPLVYAIRTDASIRLNYRIATPTQARAFCVNAPVPILLEVVSSLGLSVR